MKTYPRVVMSRYSIKSVNKEFYGTVRIEGDQLLSVSMRGEASMERGIVYAPYIPMTLTEFNREAFARLELSLIYKHIISKYCLVDSVG